MIKNIIFYLIINLCLTDLQFREYLKNYFFKFYCMKLFSNKTNIFNDSFHSY